MTQRTQILTVLTAKSDPRDPLARTVPQDPLVPTALTVPQDPPVPTARKALRARMDRSDHRAMTDPNGTDGTDGDIGPTGPTGPAGSGGGDGGGVLYTRWGRSSCPATATLVYSGIMGGAQSGQSGSGSNLLCLTSDPTWDEFDPGDQLGALMYGAQYKTSGGGLPSKVGLNNFDVPCAVCLKDTTSMTLLMPGTNVCPAAFATEYKGYLMASSYNQQQNNTFICVDRDMEALPGTVFNNPSALLYPTEGECGSLPCPPYVQDRELTCCVCTK
jgi:hypothetical protein